MTTLRKGQVRLGPRTWAAIREAYLSGVSGAALAEAYGCSLGTIRYRAVREGWRRCDVEGARRVAASPAPSPAPSGAPAGDEADDAPATPAELSEMAMAAAARALRGGKPGEAGAYLRVVEALGRITAPEEARKAGPNYIDPQELERRAADLRARAPEILALVESKCGDGRALDDHEI